MAKPLKPRWGPLVFRASVRSQVPMNRPYRMPGALYVWVDGTRLAFPVPEHLEWAYETATSPGRREEADEQMVEALVAWAVAQRQEGGAASQD